MRNSGLVRLFLINMALLSSVAGQQDAYSPKRAVKELRDIKVGQLQAKNILLGKLISQLSANTQIAFCVENRKDDAVDALGALQIDLEIDPADNVETALHKLHYRHPVVHWRIEEGIVVISAAGIESNPLDKTLKPFALRGTAEDVVRYLNSHLPGLLADTFGMAGMYPTKEVFLLEFDSEAKATQVLSRLTREYGIRWFASIRDRGTSLEIPGGPNGQPLKTTTGRVTLMFKQGPIPLLVR